jgi:hypothetical protein
MTGNSVFKIFIVNITLLLLIPVYNYACDLKCVAMFGAGMATGIVWHEVSHTASIEALGGSIDSFNFTSVEGHFHSGKSSSENNSKWRIVSLAVYTG